MRLLRSSLLAAAVILFIGARDASGQLPSVVQLPSFQTFSYSGSVLVPDRGTTSLGGVQSSAMASQRRLAGRSFGVTQANAQATVSATIIDLEEMDRQILGGSPQEFLSRGQPPSGSAGRANRSRLVDPVEEGKALVRYARQQYREGKKSESFATYQMAIGVLDGRLRTLALAEFRRVFGAAAEQSMQMAGMLR